MNLKTLLIGLAMAASAPAFACTSLIATKGASADGSSMITYAADSHTLYGDITVTPAADHPAGSFREIIDWDSAKPLGHIPQVPHTYGVVGNMNEHGLVIAESTWGGRPELEGSGTIDYGSLIYITLERARTAREAVDVMTSLVRDYGYASEGESFSIADPDEVWIMELIGKGHDDPGAVWVARRVPDGYISGHANQARIHNFPLDDPETLYSPDVISFARSKGYFDGDDKDFDFSAAYAVHDVGGWRGCDGRVWAYFRRHMPAGQADQWLPWVLGGEGEILPLWVKPEKKLAAADLKAMMRDHFEDTPLDMNGDIGAGPFDVPYRWRPLTFKVDSAEYTHERAIATQQTGFSFVASTSDSRHPAMRGILWYGVDDANTCVYIPLFNSTPEAPHQLAVGNGDLYNLSWDAMFWVNNYVANQAYNRYSQMIPDIRRVQSGLESKYESAVDSLANSISNKTSYADAQKSLWTLSADAAAETTSAYKNLGDYLLVKYLDGNIKRETAPGQFERTPYGVPAQPVFGGYNDRYYRQIVKETGDHFRISK